MKDDIIEMKDDVRKTAKGVEELRMGQEGKESCFNLFPQLYMTLSRVIFQPKRLEISWTGYPLWILQPNKMISSVDDKKEQENGC